MQFPVLGFLNCFPALPGKCYEVFSLGLGVAASGQFVQCAWRGYKSPTALSLGLAGAFCSRCWLWVTSEHLRDVRSSQGQEAAAEPKTMRKYYWPKIPNLLSEKNRFRVIKEEIK